MTIKIKAPVIWLDESHLHGFLSKRCDEYEKRYRAVSESDWRKLMKLVKAMEGHCSGTFCLPDICEALEALKEKVK